MNEKAALKKKIVSDLTSSKSHLSYSYKKVKAFDFKGELSEEQLESLESFSSRFARFSDIAIRRYFRFLAKEGDPAFDGSLIDLLNLAEKHGWIQSAERWRRIRELRNVAAHEYSSEDYKKLYQELISLAPHLIGLSLDL